MTYEEFQEYVRAKCLYETIYSDSDGREILIIQMLAAYALVNDAPKREWVGLTDEDWATVKGMQLSYIDQGVAWAAAKLKEKNT